MTATNPYDPPSEKSVDDDRRRESRKRRPADFISIMARPPVILSLFAVLHFTVSAYFWLDFAIRIVGPPAALNVTGYFWSATSTVVLLPLSVLCLVRSVRLKRWALSTIVAVYLISAGAFWYDVSQRRFQYTALVEERDVLRGEKQEEYGGWINVYCTWWWYEEAADR